MNLIFRNVWNRTLGRLVVASEAARSQGKAGVSRKVIGAVVGGAIVLPLSTLAIGALTSSVNLEDEVKLGTTNTNLVVKEESAGDPQNSVPQEVSVTLSDDIELGSVTTGSTKVDTSGVAVGNDVQLGNTGLTITGGPSITQTGIDAAGKVISNVGPGQNDTDAVNLAQLNAVSNTASAGWNATDGTNSSNIGPGGKVTFSGDGNVTVTESGTDDDGQISVALNDDLTANSLTTGNTTIDNNGLAISGGGPSVTSSGIDAGNKKITNVAGGNVEVNGAEAVTTGQLWNLTEGGDGIKYFHANSEEPDSEAIGQESVAIGPQTKAEGVSSLAAGDGAATTGGAEGAIALGQNASAGGAAAGDGGAGAIAVGRNSVASSTSATALGDGAEATVGNATALGAGANATGAGAIALGKANARGSNSFAAGAGATTNTKDSIALGSNAGIGTGVEINDPGQRHSFVAIGKDAGNNMDGNQAIAIGVGAGSNTTESNQVAIGTEAGTHLEGERNVSIGFEANKNESNREARHATAIGGLTDAATDAVAVGYGANATSQSVAMGAGAKAEAGSIALGHNSHAVQVSGTSYLTGKAFTGESVSVGNAGTNLTRRITNVEDGADATDAVNVNQLTALKDSLGSFTPESGGNVNYNDDETITVAAGQIDGQAVNLGQMNQAITDGKPRFFSVNPNGDSANENGEGALGANSANSMAIGHAAKIDDAQKATALGYSVLVKADDGTAIGSGSTVNNIAGVAIGQGAYSRGDNSLAMGTDAQTERKDTNSTSNNAIAIGTSSRATDDSASAFGHLAAASGLKSSALGYFAQAKNTDSMAFGTSSVASGVSSQASGTEANASGENAQASGTKANASGYNSIAQGTGATGYATDGIAMGSDAVAGFDDPNDLNPERNTAGIAIGKKSLADEEHALALGVEAKARAKSATAVGDGANATGTDSLAMGTGAVASKQDATAIGHGAAASAQDATAFGRQAIANKQDAMALGRGAESNKKSSVALGAGSLTDANATAETSATVNELTYGGFKGQAADAGKQLSVGSSGSERQIKNVAAGAINESSTDAINGSQLFATQTVIGNIGSSTVDNLGGNANLDEDGNITMTDVGGTKKDNVHDAIEYAAQGWDVSAEGGASENVAPGGSVDFSNTDDNIDIIRNGTDLEFALNENIDLGDTGSVTTGDTVMDTDRVTVGGSSTNDPSTTVGAGVIEVAGSGTDPNTVAIDGEAGTIGGLTNQDVDYPEFADGSGRAATEEQLDLVNTTANAGWNVSGSGENSVNIGPNGAVDFQGDSNISVAQSGTDDAGQIDIALNENIDLGDTGSVTTGDTVMNDDGVTVNDGTGSTTEVGAGSISVAGAGNSITIDGGAGDITGLTNTDLDGSDFAQAGRAATEEQLDLVNTTANAGWNVSGSGENSVNIGPNGAVDFQGDSNISVAQSGADDAGQIDIALNENIDLGDAGSVTTGDTVMNDDGVTVDDSTGSSTEVGAGSINVAGAGNSIAIDGDAGDITGLTNTDLDGSDFAQAGRAATEEQLDLVNTTANAGWNVSGSGENSVNIGPNGAVDFQGDSNISVAQSGADDAGRIDIALNENIDLGDAGSITTGDTVMNDDGVTVNDGTGSTTEVGAGSISVAGGGNSITIDGGAGDITGLTNTDLDGSDFAQAGRAATEEQLDLVNTTANAGWNLTGAGENSVNIGPNGAVDFQGDSNISVAQSGADDAGQIDIALNENIDLGDTGSVTTGDTVMDNSGVTVDDGTGSTTEVGAGSINVAGAGNSITIDGGDGTIGGLTNTTFDPDDFVSGQAATEDQLGQVSEVANAGWNVQTTDTDAAGSSNVAPEANVDFVSSDGNIDIAHTRDDATGDTSIDFALGNDLNVGGPGKDGEPGEDGFIGVNGKDGKTNVAIDGKDGSIGLAGPAGPNGTDGLTKITIQNGQPGVDGADGETTTRIIYTDPEGNDQEVANLEDGLKFEGNQGDTIAKRLNETLTVKGELANTEDASGANLRVDSEDGKLNLVMARNLTDLDSITINDGGPTINGSGIDMGDNKITNLAPGEDGTDAVNVDQLDDVSEVANAGWNLTGAGADEVNIGPNGAVDFQGDSNISVAQSGADDAGQIDIALNENIDLGDAGSVTTGDTVMNDDGVTVNDGTGSTTEVGAGTITVAANPTTGPANEIVIDANSGTVGGLTNQDVDYPEFADGSGRAASEEQLDLVNTTANAGWNVQTTDADAAGSSNVAPEANVDFVSADGNIDIEHTRDDATGDTSIDFALGNDLSVGGPGKDGEPGEDGFIGVNGKDGKTNVAIDGKDGSIGLAGPAGPNGTDGLTKITIQNGQPGVDGADGETTTRIIYTDPEGNDQEVANLEDGLKFAGNTGDTIAKRLNETLTVKGELANADDASGANLRVDSEDGKLNLVMARNLTDLDSAIFGEPGTNDQFTINKDGVQFVDAAGDQRDSTPSITETGIDGGGNQITGVGSGLGGDALGDVTGDDLNNAVNVGDLQGTSSAEQGGGFGLADANGDEVKKDLGETIKVSDPDGNITTTADDASGELQLGLSNDLSVGGPGEDGADGVDGSIAVNGKDGKTGVAINGEDGSIGLTGPSGANGTISVIDGQPGVDGVDGITRIVIDDIEVATLEDGLKFAGNTGDTIAKRLNETLTVKGELADADDASGANLRVDSADGNLNLVMAKNLTDLDSITINDGGPTIDSDGIDMGGLDSNGKPTNKITNLAPGEVSETSTDAVNGSQLWEVKDIASAGWNLTTGGDADSLSNVAPGETVNFSGDDNVLVSNEGNDVSVALNDSITLGDGDTAVTVDGDKGRVSVGSTIMDGDGLTIAGGPSVTINGIDAGGMQITNVASGMGGQRLDQISGDDLMNAVNVGDLQTVAGEIGGNVAAAKTEVEAGKNMTVKESTGGDGQTIYEVATADEVEFDRMEVGSVTIDKDNVDDDGNTIIAGVGKGEVSADSTDAVNGSQLHGVEQEIGDINSSLDGGMDFAADEGDALNRKLGDTVAITGDDNITTRTNDDGVQVALNRDLDVDSVTTGRTTVSDKGVTIEGGPSMTIDGIDGGGKRITNVAPGVDATDAANVGQLQDLNQRFYNEIGGVHNRINDLEDNAYAGVAGAIAAASIPQTTRAGESMVAVGAGTFKGESAMSVGVSRLSDNGRFAVKLNVTGDTQSNFGAGIGAGWHW